MIFRSLSVDGVWGKIGGLLPFVRVTVSFASSLNIFFGACQDKQKRIISICFRDKREKGRHSSLYNVLMRADFHISL